MSRRGRGAAGGDVSRLAALSCVGENFLQRRRLQHGYKKKKREKKDDDYMSDAMIRNHVDVLLLVPAYRDSERM